MSRISIGALRITSPDSPDSLHVSEGQDGVVVSGPKACFGLLASPTVRRSDLKISAVEDGERPDNVDTIDITGSTPDLTVRMLPLNSTPETLRQSRTSSERAVVLQRVERENIAVGVSTFRPMLLAVAGAGIGLAADQNWLLITGGVLFAYAFGRLTASIRMHMAIDPGRDAKAMHEKYTGPVPPALPEKSQSDSP